MLFFSHVCSDCFTVVKRRLRKRAFCIRLNGSNEIASLSIKNKFSIGFRCPFARAVAPRALHSTLADISGIFFKAHVLEKYEYLNEPERKTFIKVFLSVFLFSETCIIKNKKTEVNNERKRYCKAFKRM